MTFTQRAQLFTCTFQNVTAGAGRGSPLRCHEVGGESGVQGEVAEHVTCYTQNLQYVTYSQM